MGVASVFIIGASIVKVNKRFCEVDEFEIKRRSWQASEDRDPTGISAPRTPAASRTPE